MNKMLSCLIAVLISFAAFAETHSAVEVEVREAVKAFNGAYESNDVDTYFDYYVDDATLYFSGSRQQVSAYQKQWTEMVEAGGAVEKYALSDIRVQVLQNGDAAVATYYVDVRMRVPGSEASEARAFESDVWQKIDGEWKVISLHYTEIPPE